MLELFNEIKEELKKVEEELHSVINAPNPLISKTSKHLLNAGGKRLRPAFCLLGGKCADFDLKKILPLAVALELIHMATLVHDDVVDSALTRRGVLTVKALWGNKVSAYTGSYLFAKSLILISHYEEPLISKVLSDTSIRMCEGEIYQIYTCFNVEQTVRDYLDRIKRKTALLISASCQLGAVACGGERGVFEPLRRYGYNLGMAFQITDDILDLTADENLLGKPVGSDLREGILTLPVIYALSQSPRRQRLREVVSCRDKSQRDVHEAIDMVKECGGVAYSAKIAQKYISKAKSELELLPDKPAKKTLALIADFIRSRRF